MKNKIIISISTFLVVLVLLSIIFNDQQKKQDDSMMNVSGDVILLGNPLANRWSYGESIYARNIWDLQKYQGRIYIGSGNSANKGPAGNAGPIDIWSYDPKQNKFVNEGKVNDEQIDIFKVINGQLVIPGHDAAAPDNWDFGNFYRKEGDKWIKYRRIPKGIHVYDMIAFQNKLFAALGSHASKSAVSISEDDGENWITTPVGFYRFYTFFELNGKLYVSGIFRSDENIKRLRKFYPKHEKHIPYALYEYKNNQMLPVDLNITEMFPQWPHKRAKIRRPIDFNNSLVFLVSSPSNDHQYKEQGLYSMKEVGESQRLEFPKRFIPQDIVNDGERILVLATQQIKVAGNSAHIPELNYKNAVFETKDLKNWKLRFSFSAETFARSFEYMDGCFYFGMGTDVKEEAGKWWPKWNLSPQTGWILKSTRCLL